MSVIITGEASRSCLGDSDETFAALLRGEAGARPMRHIDRAAVNVTTAYQIADGEREEPLRASGWLADCVAEALARSGVDPARERVVAIVGTGLRELRTVELGLDGGRTVPTERLHFADAVRAAAPGLADVLTVSNACSAGGHALALAQDVLEFGLADAVVVGATDTLTASMLTMIGRVGDQPTVLVRPFDADRTGVLLGEGAVAVVVQPEDAHGRPLARVRATGLSCDAHHETAPHAEGIRRAVDDAFDRAGLCPGDVDLVVAHGSGTALNDPTEATVARDTFASGTGRPVVTAIKGAVGHTSGGAALLAVVIGVHCLTSGRVPPVVGLRRPLVEAHGLHLATEELWLRPRIVQVNAFGFGGVNAVSLLERAGDAPSGSS